MVFEINQENLKEDLIHIYSCYLSKNKDLNDLSISLAKDLDGLWSGDFILNEILELALNNLSSFYIEPKISKNDVKKILQKLRS